MIAALLLATVINSCPTPLMGNCQATMQTFEAHQVVRWDGEWPCDGSVWWVATINGQSVIKRCGITPTQTGDTIINCPTSIAPVKHWDFIPNEQVWLHINACNVHGCSPGCSIQLTWPTYTVLP